MEGGGVSVKWTASDCRQPVGGGAGGTNGGGGGTTVIASGPVTVTSINVPGPGPGIDHTNIITNKNSKNNTTCFQQHCNGLGSSVISGKCNVLVGNASELVTANSHDQDDGSGSSDAEVSKIDFSGVHMRNKKKKKQSRGGGTEGEGAEGMDAADESRDGLLVERPMSWEGELLSDSEEMPSIKQEDDCEEDEDDDEDDHEGAGESMEVGGVGDGEGGGGGGKCGGGGLHHLPPPLKFIGGGIDQVLREHVRVIGGGNCINSGGNALHQHNAHTELPLLVDKLLSSGYNPAVLQQRQQSAGSTKGGGGGGVGPTPSPDSAVYSCYSPTASPVTSRHGMPTAASSSSGISSPFTPSLSRNNSDASQYGGSQHSSCYSQSYSSVSVSPTQFSPTHSPVQGRHMHRPGFPSPVLNSRGGALQDLASVQQQQQQQQSGGLVFSSSSSSSQQQDGVLNQQQQQQQQHEQLVASIVGGEHGVGRGEEEGSLLLEEKINELVQHSAGLAPTGISRQQLINSPCPICGDKISGFHYGIFSCESCKGFFKRTVQNRKNYVCLRGSSCPVTIATRKKCPACRFDKCLQMGMKLEAIREDRTRGGRSTYQCSYTLPPNTLIGGAASMGGLEKGLSADSTQSQNHPVKQEPVGSNARLVPPLLQEMMEVEHLWQYNEQENRPSRSSNPGSGPDFLSNLCNIADHRLYKIVKWCKSLPLFKNISIDDQISLLINAWCELLLFSCCFRSMSSPGEIRVSLGKSISLQQARHLGLQPAIERMLNFTQHLRRLRVDQYEYVAMKVIVLLTSDASDLREPEKVRASQEKALQALQHYTLAHYPDIPSKFGELLLRIPDLQRTCQVGKEMLSIKNKEGEGPSFNLLMELLRGDH